MVFARMHDIVVIWNFHEWKPYSLCADGADGSGSGFIKKGNKACHAALFGTVFSGRRSSGGVEIRTKPSGSRNKALILSRLLPQKRKRVLDDGSILSWSSITAQSPSMDLRISV